MVSLESRDSGSGVCKEKETEKTLQTAASEAEAQGQKQISVFGAAFRRNELDRSLIRISAVP